MKIHIIFTFCLISGPVDCSEVTGYSGGSIVIYSNIPWYINNSKYICKMKGKDCADIIRADTSHSKVQSGRFKMYANTKKHFLVLIRKLKPQDAGTYRFGLGNQSNFTVNLKVINDPCCAGPKINAAYLGKNFTMTHKYPVVYQKSYKQISKLDDGSELERVLDTKTNFQNGRYSVSDDRSAKVLSVNISEVREADEGFYLLGVKIDGPVDYNSYFTETHLYIRVMSTTIQPTTSATYLMTSAALTETSAGAVHLRFFVIISACFTVSLLLIAGFALMICRLKCKTTQGSSPSSRRHQAHCDNGNDLDDLPLYENRNLCLNHSTSKTDSTYECLNPETQINSVYNIQ